MSQYGNLKHIVDLETMMGFRLSKIDFSSITGSEPISYSWGDESALTEWIKHKDLKQSVSGNFYSISGSQKTPIEKRKKYPLIWMVTPVQGENLGKVKRFRGVTLIICSNTKEEWFNSTRWKQHIPMLQALADKVIEGLKGDLKLMKEDGVLNFSYRNVPKYAISEKGSGKEASIALDLWDAVVLNVDLLANNICKNEEYIRFCNN